MRYWAFPLLTSTLFISFLTSMVLGSVRFSADAVLLHIVGYQQHSSLLGAVIDLRLVRSLTALITGASLGVAGSLLQSLFRNPLADPYILGISSGSSLAIAATLVLGLGLGLVQSYDPYSLYMAGALGAAATSVLVILLSSLMRTYIGLVLAGVMLGYLNAGLTTLIIYTSEIEIVRAFYFWTFGTFSSAKWSLIEAVFPLTVGGFVAAFMLAKPMNAIAFGDEIASSMGVWIRGARVAIVTAASSIVSAATVLSGAVGFIGLAAPHIARLTAGTADNRVIIPLSALAGATIAIISDVAARNLMTPLDLPVTAITSIFGAPLIILLLMRRGRRL
ncbi:Hemin transport system permease protein HmuU [archaeon HR01]|nr:Hemin transport system permease protein HmuU [archaeon HR01]